MPSFCALTTRKSGEFDYTFSLLFLARHTSHWNSKDDLPGAFTYRLSRPSRKRRGGERRRPAISRARRSSGVGKRIKSSDCDCVESATEFDANDSVSKFRRKKKVHRPFLLVGLRFRLATRTRASSLPPNQPIQIPLNASLCGTQKWFSG